MGEGHGVEGIPGFKFQVETGKMLLSLTEIGTSGRGVGLGVEGMIVSAQLVHSAQRLYLFMDHLFISHLLRMILWVF